MGPTAAVAAALRGYVDFRGRSRRGEFWWFVLSSNLLLGGGTVLDAALTGGVEAEWSPVGVLVLIASLALTLPTLAIWFRRLHDADHSAWWLLILVVPLAGPLALLLVALVDGTPGPNRFGPDPKERHEFEPV